MKNYYLIILFLLIWLEGFAKANDSIFYKFNEEINGKIYSSYNLLKKVQKLEKPIFILIRNSDSITTIVIEDAINMSKEYYIAVNTNRFLKYKTVVLPIIFESDILFADKKKTSIEETKTGGGYVIVIENRKMSVVKDYFED